MPQSMERINAGRSGVPCPRCQHPLVILLPLRARVSVIVIIIIGIILRLAWRCGPG